MIASTDGLAYRIALIAAPYGDGHHYSVRAVGGAAAVSGGSRDAPAQPQMHPWFRETRGMAGIRLEDVSVDYPVERRGTAEILSGIDLEIDAGEFVSIVGQTGCGKSTLLRLILAEEMPTGGRVLVDGRERPSPIATAAMSRRNIRCFPTRPCWTTSRSDRRSANSALFLAAVPPVAAACGNFARRRCVICAGWACTSPTAGNIPTSSPAACSSASPSRRR